MPDKKIKGKTKAGEELIDPTKEQYETLKSIVQVHAEYLMESFSKSVAVLQTRIEIAAAMDEVKEIIYYTGALEQSRVYMDMLCKSVNEVEDWCGVKTVDGEPKVVDAKKSKGIKRIPVTKTKKKPMRTKTKKPKKGKDDDKRGI